MVPQVLRGRSCLITISLTLDGTYKLNPWVIRQTRQNYCFGYYKDEKKDVFVINTRLPCIGFFATFIGT